MQHPLRCLWAQLVIIGCAALLSFAAGAENRPDTSESAKSDMELGLAAIERGEFVGAFAKFKTLANAGNAEAQHNLAMLYRTGKGVKKDLADSVRWFRRAADQGVADAQYYLGYMYENGEGLKQSSRYAFVWYRKAAEQGHGLAQVNLGVMYADGVGVQQDVELAYLWFHVAAAQGFRAAFQNKMIIEEALTKEGWSPTKLAALKARARAFFQQYVMPFTPPPSPSRRPSH
jgi:hypothetical protein